MEGILRKHNDGKREKNIRETTMRQQVSYLVVNPKIASHNKILWFSYIRTLVSWILKTRLDQSDTCHNKHNHIRGFIQFHQLWFSKLIYSVTYAHLPQNFPVPRTHLIWLYPSPWVTCFISTDYNWLEVS